MKKIKTAYQRPRFSLQKMICNWDPVFFLAGMPGKEPKVEKKINRDVIRTGETDIKVHLILNPRPNYPIRAEKRLK